MQFRIAEPKDFNQIKEVFVLSIQKLCSKQYTQEQIKAWTSSVSNEKRWLDKIENQHFILAFQGNQLLGFGSLEGSDYIDFMYVHPDYTRQGIADKILDRLLQRSLSLGALKVNSDVSKTAKNFFLKKGFEVIKENEVQIQGISLNNYRMCLKLDK